MPELQANQPPPADYYAANLRRLVDFVVTNYGDLLKRWDEVLAEKNVAKVEISDDELAKFRDQNRSFQMCLDATDRILALDTLYINAAAVIVLYGVHIGRPDFFEAALLIALLGFVSTMALAKFLLRGDIIE